MRPEDGGRSQRRCQSCRERGVYVADWASFDARVRAAFPDPPAPRAFGK